MVAVNASGSFRHLIAAEAMRCSAEDAISNFTMETQHSHNMQLHGSLYVFLMAGKLWSMARSASDGCMYDGKHGR